MSLRALWLCVAHSGGQAPSLSLPPPTLSSFTPPPPTGLILWVFMFLIYGNLS